MGRPGFGTDRLRPAAELLDGLVSVEGPERSLRSLPWHIESVNAPAAWSRGALGEGVTVAVVDTGVNARHPDLRTSVAWSGRGALIGWSARGNVYDVRDELGHGTMCAGLVAGDGSQGVACGVAPLARILPIKAVGRDGASQSMVWEGVERAVAYGADVISLSISFNRSQSPNHAEWRRLCDYVLSAGVTLCCSAGNLGSRLDQYPPPHNIPLPGSVPPPWLHPEQRANAGGTSGAITCGATDMNDAPTRRPACEESSGRGPVSWNTIGPYHDYPWAPPDLPGLLKPDVCAPGTALVSTHASGSGYGRMSGASGAVPLVAGAAALLKSAVRNASPEDLCEALEMSAVRSGGARKDNTVGSGRIDAARALEYLMARCGPRT